MSKIIKCQILVTDPGPYPPIFFSDCHCCSLLLIKEPTVNCELCGRCIYEQQEGVSHQCQATECHLCLGVSWNSVPLCLIWIPEKCSHDLCICYVLILLKEHLYSGERDPFFWFLKPRFILQLGDILARIKRD